MTSTLVELGTKGVESTSMEKNAVNRSKKRNRAVLSCLTCHSRRVKCNRKQPCEACVNFGCAEECTFAISPSEQSKRSKKSSDDGLERRESGSQEDDSSPEQSLTLSTNNHQMGPRPSQQANFTIFQSPVTNSEPARQYTMSAFNNFVERFQQHTQSDERNKINSAYSDEAVSTITTARNDLPTPERTKLLILYFFEHLEWSYELGDYDDMNTWLVPFLDKMSQRSLSPDRLTRGDATRLGLVLTILAAGLQVANEGLVQVYFLDSSPVSFSQANLTRKSVKDVYESHVRDLLDAATQQDGSSTDLVRSSMIYCYFLKNEGRHCESGNEPLIKSISRIVQETELHIDPPVALSSYERNSRRRLFWTYYGFSRMTAAHHGHPIAIPDHLITTKEVDQETWSPTFGRKVNTTCIYKSRLSRIGGKLAGLLMAENAITVRSVDIIEKDLQAWVASLPPELAPSLDELPPDLFQLRSLDLSRRYLLVMYNSVRGSLHRLCFFPTESINNVQVRKSRKMCVESAMEMIKIQESLRLRLVSEHGLRCFFLPYFMLESAITLVLTTLIEVGNIPPGSPMPDNIKEYLKWAHRALNLLVSLPSDFQPAVQGARLLSRVLTKASQILELHAQHKLTAMESNSAIRDVLCDDEGRRMAIPLHEPASRSTATTTSPGQNTSPGASIANTRTPASLNNSSSVSDFSATVNPPSDFLSAMASFPASIPDYSVRTPATADQNYTYGSAKSPFPAMSSQVMPEPLGEPTYADLGLDFFDVMAGALSNPFSNEAEPFTLPQQQQQQLLSITNQMPQQQTLGQGQNGLDDQMDMWLSSLQTY